MIPRRYLIASAVVIAISSAIIIVTVHVDEQRRCRNNQSMIEMTIGQGSKC